MFHTCTCNYTAVFIDSLMLVRFNAEPLVRKKFKKKCLGKIYCFTSMHRKPLQIIIFLKIETGQVPYICAKLVVIVAVINNCYLKSLMQYTHSNRSGHLLDFLVELIGLFVQIAVFILAILCCSVQMYPKFESL